LFAARCEFHREPFRRLFPAGRPRRAPVFRGHSLLSVKAAPGGWPSGPRSSWDVPPVQLLHDVLSMPQG
jgi:hypothetical protein